jgi:hypothetical protein
VNGSRLKFFLIQTKLVRNPDKVSTVANQKHKSISSHVPQRTFGGPQTKKCFLVASPKAKKRRILCPASLMAHAYSSYTFVLVSCKKVNPEVLCLVHRGIYANKIHVLVCSTFWLHLKKNHLTALLEPFHLIKHLPGSVREKNVCDQDRFKLAAGGFRSSL